MRINKYLALCGFGSRRKAEELVTRGSVIINGSVTKDLSATVDPDNDTVLVHGKEVHPPKDHVYLVMNKPKGYITTLKDEKDRPTVMDLVPEKYKRQGVFPVGRLDKNTEGLLLFTNDGDLANLISSPKSHIEKRYLVLINKPLKDDHIRRLTRGVYVAELKITTRFAGLKPLGSEGNRWEAVLTEGKKRQVRHLFQALGYRVKQLERTSYGPLTLEGTKRGFTRPLKAGELNRLKKALANQ